MTLQDLGNIGEFIGAIGVVASLVYLALQIRQNTEHLSQNTRSVRAASFHATSSLLAQFFSTVNGDQELSRIFRIGLEDPNSLDPDARERFKNTVGQMFSYLQDVFHQHREGLLEGELWESRHANIVSYLAEPGVQEFWQQRRGMYTRSFRALVDAELATVESGARDSGDASA